MIHGRTALSGRIRRLAVAFATPSTRPCKRGSVSHLSFIWRGYQSTRTRAVSACAVGPVTGRSRRVPLLSSENVDISGDKSSLSGVGDDHSRPFWAVGLAAVPTTLLPFDLAFSQIVGIFTLNLPRVPVDHVRRESVAARSVYNDTLPEGGWRTGGARTNFDPIRWVTRNFDISGSSLG